MAKCPDCVEGFYWCDAHDIYARTPERVAKLSPAERSQDDFVLAKQRSCTCFILAPCSFCCPNIPS
jgi:hypothetical protein